MSRNENYSAEDDIDMAHSQFCRVWQDQWVMQRRISIEKSSINLGIWESRTTACEVGPAADQSPMLVAFFEGLGTWDRNIIKYKDDEGETTNLS